ncbi:protein-serine/threonine phosphatase [Salmonella enterica subsp. enterica serovar Sangera]|nr:protein-serine/threonine phosphatase [Salmonella enterica subsp. enterica serovar Sangera]
MELIRYADINSDLYRHIWVVGDIHGCYSLLLTRLAQLHFSPDTDLLISTGDNIDRGKENLETLRLLNTPWFISVVGNHEAMALDAFETQDGNFWYVNGGYWYDSVTEKDRQEATELLLTFKQRPHIIEVETSSKKYVIAHADYPDDSYDYGKQVDIDSVLWSRDRLLGSLQGNIHPIRGADTFIFGHMIVDYTTTFANKIYIDTGSFCSGNLSFFKIK